MVEIDCRHHREPALAAVVGGVISLEIKKFRLADSLFVFYGRNNSDNVPSVTPRSHCRTLKYAPPESAKRRF